MPAASTTCPDPKHQTGFGLGPLGHRTRIPLLLGHRKRHQDALTKFPN